MREPSRFKKLARVFWKYVLGWDEYNARIWRGKDWWTR